MIKLLSINESSNRIDEASEEYDVFKGKKYYVIGSVSNYPGELSKSSKPVYTNDPKVAIESWFRINKTYPTYTRIMTRTKKGALELINYANDNKDWIMELYNKYKCHYKLDYLIKAIEDKAKDGCKSFRDSEFGDMIYPFDIG